ncbi:hypothetical protein [Embleya sp. NBC_00896]|uniref:hypothetical protein n=1 Tax=Embleya sp. NBC_00896 TaxID=2975961 RepID=UPI00386F8166|nr:hypothetical protein OG928_29610 [Embleya sp. NBC_00896]
MNDMESTFAGAGLAIPPVPDALRNQLAPRDRWLFATRGMRAFDMYMFERYPIEAVAEAVPDYFAVSHAGHGVNSYALNYHLVYGPLALFVQLPWGGVYMDGRRCAVDIGRAFTAAAELIRAADAVRDTLDVGSTHRLIVVLSALRGGVGAAWLDAPLGEPGAAVRWLGEVVRSDADTFDDLPALDEAVRLLRAGPGRRDSAR